MWCEAAARANADLWRLLWFGLEDLGGLGAELKVLWFLGHDDGEHLEARGNRLADAMGKCGAAMHEVSEHALAEAQGLRDKLTAILRWLGGAAVAASHASRPERQPNADRPRRTATDRTALAAARQPPQSLARRTAWKQ